MDIGSNNSGVAARLSNFQPRPFILNLNSRFLPDEIKSHPDFIQNIENNKNNLLKIDNNFCIKCSSMEGALQSLKCKEPHIAIYSCTLVAKVAKNFGSKKNKKWKSIQTLWFFGLPIKRDSKLLQKILDYLYISMYMTNESFRKDLLSTRDAVFSHSIGKNKESDTVLTEREFCSRLTKLRNCRTILDIQKEFKYE